MGMTFGHLLAGFAGFTATVATPWYAADPSLIPIAFVLLLGLILSCVSVAIFQHSINKKGKQVRKPSEPTESEMFQTLEQAIEDGRASLDLDVAAPPGTPAETPSPLAELAQQFDKALPEPRPEPQLEPMPAHDQIAQSVFNGSNGTNQNEIVHPPPNPARPGTAAHEETARVSLPRLSELRGMRFSQALRELDKAKRSAPLSAGPNSLNASFNRSLNDALADRHDDTPNEALNDLFNDPINETLMNAIAPFEPIFAPSASAPQARNGATAMHENGVAATKDNNAQERRSQQTFSLPNPASPANNKGRRREDIARSPRDPKAPGKETDGFLDQLQVLPSRRGQYKKKG